MFADTSYQSAKAEPFDETCFDGICSPFAHLNAIHCAVPLVLIGLILATWGGEAYAACTPALIGGEANVTANCSGNVANQNAANGYGTGDQTNITVNADATANITGTYGIRIGTGSINLAGGAVAGTTSGVSAAGALELFNLGTITGQGVDGVRSFGVTNVINAGAVAGASAGINIDGGGTVINLFGGSITGSYGINALASLNFANGGTLSGANIALNAPTTTVSVVNNGFATISGGSGGIFALSADIVNTGNITSAGGSAVRTGGRAVLTNNSGGVVSGSTYGVQAGAGGSSIVNAGTISGGTAAILFSGTGNRLMLTPTSIINGAVTGGTNNALELGGIGAGTFNLSAVGTQYQNFSMLSLVGPATWTLQGTNSLAQPIAVSGGTLAVNGMLTSESGVSINANGTLSGTGTINGSTIISGGILSPGNSIGTLTINGNLALTSASTYMVEVDPNGADRTNVTGTATLGGARLSASFANGSYVTRRYTIVSAQGGVSGTFSSLVSTNLPTNFTSAITYDANNAYLDIALSFETPSTEAPTGPRTPIFAPLTANQRNVAGALISSFNSAGGIPLVFGALSATGLTQVSGEHATGTQQTTFDAMDKFVNVLTDRFGGTLANDAAQIAASGYAHEDGSLAYVARRPQIGAERDAYAAFKATPRALPIERRWSVWGAGYGGTQQTAGDSGVGSQKFTNEVYGGAAGFDYRLTPETLIGFALGGGATNFGLTNGLGGGQSEMFQAGLYGRRTSGPAYVSGAVAWGWQDVTLKRTVFANNYRADFDANAISGRLEGGWRLAYGASGMTPYAAGQVTSLFLPGYAEELVAGVNTFALAYSGKDVTASRAELGLRGDTSFVAADAMVTLRGRAAWAHNFNTDRSISALFQTLPTSTFTVFGALPAEDSALVSTSAEVRWLNGFSITATFEGEFSNRTESYSGRGTLRYQW